MKIYIRASKSDPTLNRLKDDLMDWIISHGFYTKLDKADITGQYYEVAVWAIADDDSRCRVYLGYSTYQYSDDDYAAYGDVARKPYSVLFNYGRKTRFISQDEAFSFIEDGLQNSKNFM